MTAVPGRPSLSVAQELPSAPDLENLAERAVASVFARGSTWMHLQIPRSPRARPYDRYQRAYHPYPHSRAHHAALGYLMIAKTIFPT
jgi:hypothetical protein